MKTNEIIRRRRKGIQIYICIHAQLYICITKAGYSHKTDPWCGAKLLEMVPRSSENPEGGGHSCWS